MQSLYEYNILVNKIQQKLTTGLTVNSKKFFPDLRILLKYK